jgi:PBP/GOBP family
MNTLVIFIIIVLYKTANSLIIPFNVDMLVNETIKECKIKEAATDEDVSLFFTENEIWPKSEEGKCLFECFLEDMGIVIFEKL